MWKIWEWKTKLDQLETELKKLREETMGEKKKENYADSYDFLNRMYWSYQESLKPFSLKEEMEDLDTRIDGLYDHLGLEDEFVTIQKDRKLKITKKDSKKKK